MSEDSPDIAQLKKYARDLSKVYKSEKEKTKELENVYKELEKYARDLTELYKSEKEKRKELKVANKQLMNYADALNKTVLDLKSANHELQHAYQDTIHRLVLASEFKDEDTGGHITRISRYSALIAEKLGFKRQ